jgi:hypothetical protein
MRAAGIEPQHSQAGQRGQAERRLPEQVAVHHAAVRGQRVQADQRGNGIGVRGKGQFSDQPQPV